MSQLKLFPLLLIVGLLVFAVGCGDDEEEGSEATSSDGGGELVIDGEVIADEELWAAAQEEGTLTLYTAISEEREQAIDEAFEEQTGLKIKLVHGTGSETFQRVQSEHSAGKLQADVIRETDVTLARDLDDLGVYQEYCPAFYDEFPEDVKGPDCHYWAPIMDVYALAYNTELVDASEAPTTWDDLLDPKWKGKIGLPYIGAGGSTWSRDLWLRKEKGVEYWEALAAQDPVLSTETAATTDQLVRGQIEVAMAIPPTVGSLIRDGAPLEVVLPEDGVPAYSVWTGLAEGAEHPNAAQVFLNWSASMAGQKAVAEAAGDYPTRPGAPAPVIAEGTTLPPADDVNMVFPESEPEYASEREAWNKEWLRIFNYSP